MSSLPARIRHTTDYTISLATADRRRALAFYRDGLGLEAFGPLADDGVPEPLDCSKRRQSARSQRSLK
jgi:hypothetical protein